MRLRYIKNVKISLTNYIKENRNIMNTKLVLINGEKTNYDGTIDYSILSDDVSVYPDCSHEDLLNYIQGAGIVVVKEYPLPYEVIKQFPDTVHLLCEAGTGYNNINLEACKEKGITVCNIPAYSTTCVAQTAMMMILNCASSMRKQITMLNNKDHSNFNNFLSVSHVELQGKTLGIVGAGNIGKSVAKLGAAFGMKVLIYTRTPRENTEDITYTDFETVVKNADFLSLHCPLTDKTFHLIGEKELGMMKKTAYLINTARGPLVDEVALIKALQEGVIAGAGLDVQEVEPTYDDNPLYDMDNVIITPHMGWKGLETRKRLIDILADNVHAYINGEPRNVVSK